MSGAANTIAALDARPAAASLGWISLAVFAREVLGTNAKSAGRAGRDWCVSRKVPYSRDGKHNYARVEDLRRALDTKDVLRIPSDRRDAIEDAVAKMKRTG